MRDARAVAAALRRLSFTVLEKVNLDRLAMEDILGQFGDQARAAEVALVFYAGHGIQVDGRNYLLPVDARLEQERDLRRLIPLDDMLKEASQASRFGLVILDSCRDNPLTQTLARSLGPTRSVAVGRGLARIERTPSETLVAFATRDNAVASDGFGEHSPFTTALLKHLETPGLEVRLLFGQVRDTVLAMTNRNQEPYIYGSLGGTPIYLAPSVVVPVAITPPAGASPVTRPPVAVASNPPAGGSVTLPSPFRRPPEPVSQPGRVFRDFLKDGSPGPEMVAIPGGTFLMGSPASEVGRGFDERQHSVSVKSFAIGKFEVTVGQFKQFVKAADYQTEAEKSGGCYYWTGSEWQQEAGKNWRTPGFTQTDEHPVVCVSWNDAVAYTEWLSNQTGQRYRLPTEAEWEYAARARTTTAYYWGDNADEGCRFANGADQTAKAQFNWTGIMECQDGYVYTAPTGRFQPNAWNLYDMSGNVWEWTCSEYDKDYSGAEQRCITDKNSNNISVLRGGSWSNGPVWLRGAARDWYDPRSRNYGHGGFRLART